MDLVGALLLFFGSGISGLVFEVIWVRSLALWVGHSTLAVSLVVAAFLAGLVVGSYLGGRWADRVTRPLRLYGILELVVGGTALAVSVVVSHLGHAPGSLALLDSLSARMVASFLLLLPPTVAMGATTPALARFVTKDIAHVGRAFALLYAVNTLGAALGCGLAGFVWVGHYGLFRTALVAVAFNGLVGGAALVWSRRDRANPTREVAEIPVPPAESKTGSRGLARGLYALAFSTGAASIACEVLWFRVLRTFVESSTYAFTLLLTTFLVGLVAGGGLFAWQLAGRARPWQLLADLQIMLALAGLASIALLGKSGPLRELLKPIVGSRSPVVAEVLLIAVVIFVPTVLSGATYPLVMKLGQDTLARVGRRIGALAAANTVGGALASLVTGLWLIPLLGTQRGLAIAFTVNLVVAVTVQVAAPDARDGGLRRLVVWPAIFLVLTWVVAPSDYIRRALTYWSSVGNIVAVREGRDGTAVVNAVDRASVCAASTHHCKEHCKTDFQFQQLTFGSMSYANTLPAGRRYMRALGHLPMLLRPGATRALEICFGTGTTAGAFAAYPGLVSLTIVDINRDVFDLAGFFRESNHDVLGDPRVHAVVDDGRHFLLTKPDVFDVISLEPPPPEADGAASLYTTDFYELARRRLAEGGVLAQWIPLHQQTDGLDRSLLRSIADVFPEVNVYLPSRVEAVVVASTEPLRADVAAWDALVAIPSVHESLREVGLDAPEEILGTLMLDTAGVARYVASAAPVTDDLPAIEFFRSRGGPPFALEGLEGLAVNPATAATALSPARETRLVEETTAARLQMAAYIASLAKDDGRARALVEEAVNLVGDVNVYAKMLRDTELDCVSLDNP